MDECVLCGGKNFFQLDDGHSYCSICQTRNDNVEELEELGVGHRIRSGTKQKTQEHSKNWTSYEAFNIILAKETDILSNLFNLGDDFKKIVFSLWITYLEKNEIAFEDNVNFTNQPKLNQLLLRHDYDFYIKGETELKRIKFEPKIRKSKSSYQIGNKKINIINKDANNENQDINNNELNNDVNNLDDQYNNLDNQDNNLDNQDNNLDNQDNDLNDEDNDLNDEDDSSNHLSNFDNFLKNQNVNLFSSLTKEEKKEIYLKYHFKELNQLDEPDYEEDKLEEIIRDEILLLNVLTNQNERSKQEKRLKQLKEAFHYSKYARNIIKIGLFKKNKNKIKHNALNFRDINHITIAKLICILYLSIRILNYDIYLYDLIRLIKFNHLPYLKTYQLLPDDWKFIGHDSRIFIRDQAPNLFEMKHQLTLMINYLQIPKLPIPNIKKLIARISIDLNLPNDLINYICYVFEYQLENEKKLENYFNPIKNNWFTIPNYEMIAFGFIILMLNYLFCLDDYHETILSDELKLKKSNNNFIWTEWEEHILFKLECFKIYIYPFKIKSPNYEFKNYDMLIDFYLNDFNNKKPELFEDITYLCYKEGEEAIKTIPKLFENLIETDEKMTIDSTDEQYIPTNLNLNFYPFKAYTNYIDQNFETRNNDLLIKNFKTKKIDYLFMRKCKNICIDNPRIPLAKSINEYEQKFNDKLKFLIELSSCYLGTDKLKFSQLLVNMEQHFFDTYFKIILKNSNDEQIYLNKLNRKCINEISREYKLEYDENIKTQLDDNKKIKNFNFLLI